MTARSCQPTRCHPNPHSPCPQQGRRCPQPRAAPLLSADPVRVVPTRTAHPILPTTVPCLCPTSYRHHPFGPLQGHWPQAHVCGLQPIPGSSVPAGPGDHSPSAAAHPGSAGRGGAGAQQDSTSLRAAPRHARRAGSSQTQIRASPWGTAIRACSSHPHPASSCSAAPAPREQLLGSTV